MVILQAMMAFPFIAILLLGFAFAFMYSLLSVVNVLLSKITKDESFRIPPLWVSIFFAILALAYFVQRLIYYDEPLIN